MKRWLIIFLLLIGLAHGQGAQGQAVAAQSQAIDQRLYDYMLGIRCLVCAGESVATSASPMARSLRMVITEQWQAGQDEKTITDFLRKSYGDQIFFRPPFNKRTLLLWLSPLVLLVIALFIGWRVFRPK